MPGAANANQSFLGSVEWKEGDRTTISLACDGDCMLTEYYGTGPARVTVGGTTYVGYQASATDTGSGNAVTVDLACSRENGSAAPTCTMTTRDAVSESNLHNSYCESQRGTSTTTYTVTDTPWSNNGDGSPVPRIVTETIANMCTGDFDPNVFPQTTMTMSGDEQYFINNYKLVITAGTEKLSASAASTPTGSGARSTSGPSSSRSSGIAQATGVAAPMRTTAPALVGLAAAAAFFV